MRSVARNAVYGFNMQIVPKYLPFMKLHLNYDNVCVTMLVYKGV